jgi:multisubunit Na+/H+ antiporter MnhF subunit
MDTLSVEIQAIIVLFSQIVFVFLRTVNVKTIADNKLPLAILSGNAMAITGLLSIAIGIHSILDRQLLPVIAYLIGGSIGTFLAMRNQMPEKRASGGTGMMFLYGLIPFRLKPQWPGTRYHQDIKITETANKIDDRINPNINTL